MILRRGLLAGLLAFCIIMATIQFWIPVFIYRPTSLPSPDPLQWQLPGAKLVRITFGDGTAITGWWAAPASPESPVALIVHGRSANISTRAPVMRRLVAKGFGVFLFDYRGYGASSGHPDENSLTQDTLASYRWLRGHGVAARRIVVVGQSLGNSAAAKLAASQPIGALILVSPFTSLPEAMTDRLPWLPVQLVPWTRNRFDVADSLKRFGGPVLLVASRSDGLVAMANTQKLRSGGVPFRWMDASPLPHNGILQAIAQDGRLANAIRALLP